jgi:hypothetical protein
MNVTAVFIVGALYVILVNYLEVYKECKIARERSKNKYVGHPYRLLTSRWK